MTTYQVIALDKLSKLVLTLAIFIFITPIYQTHAIGASSTSEATLVVEDALGREIEITTHISRVVSLSPSITEIVFALGKQDLLVGVDALSYNDQHYGIASYVKERGIENIGGYWWSLVNVEAVARLNPDLVFADKGAHLPLLNTFEEIGLKVIYLNGGSSKDLVEIYRDIEIIGEVLNCSSEASQLVLKIKNEFALYGNYIREQMYSVKYLFIISIDGGIWVAGRSTFIDDALSKLGLTNVIDKDGWLLISLEELYVLSPDIIMITTMSENDIANAMKMIDEYGINKLASKIIIFKPLESDYFLRPGPLVSNIPRTTYILLEEYGFRKPPPVNESRYIPIIHLSLIMLIMLIFTVRRN